MYLRKLKIGNVELNNNIILGPMAGLTDRPFRIICEKFNPGLVVTEMVSSKALFYNDNKTKTLLNVEGEKKPISIQIFGNDEEAMSYATKYICEKRIADIIDINMGCPVPKVAVRAQAGSALLKNPDKIFEIISAVVKAVKVPVTVKIRSGWDEKNINAVEVAKVCEKAGASAIAIHARTRSQGYSGKADWSIIKKVKEAVNIPVIGNGDVNTPELAKQMLEETNCDAVMIGRGVLGNPWLIRDCVSYLENGTIPNPPSDVDRINMMKKHYELLLNDKPEKVANLEIRAFILYYLKGMPKNKEIKNKICQSKTSEEMFKILEDYLSYLNTQ